MSENSWVWALRLETHRQMKALYLVLHKGGEKSWKKEERRLLEALRAAPVSDAEPYGA